MPDTQQPQARPPARKGGGLVVLHDAVGPFDLGWRKNRVVVPGEDFNGKDADAVHTLDDAQIDRLRRLGAVRDATAEELAADADARAKANEEGAEFAGYHVPEEPPGDERVSAGR